MKKFDTYQIITIVLAVLIIIAIGFLVFNAARGDYGKAAVSVNVENGKASVLINDKSFGETPVYTEQVFTKSINVTINGDNNSYTTTIKPSAGTKAVIKRDLGVSESFSSGQNLWFTKTGGSDESVSVISPDDDEVLVIVDGVEMGKTPLKFTTKDLLNQNDNKSYNLTFKKDGYEDQTIDVSVMEGYELNISVDMFLRPIPTEVSTIDGLPEGVRFLNFSYVSEPAFTDRQSWAKAINYWLSTRSATAFGNYKVEKFSDFVTDEGKIYNDAGNEINPEDISFEADTFVAYLGSDQSPDLTDAAKEVLSKAGQTVSTASGAKFSVKIKSNSLGYLRIRSGPGTTNNQVGRAKVGSTYEVLEEQNGWYKINYEDSKEGWISGSTQYVEKAEEAGAE